MILSEFLKATAYWTRNSAGRGSLVLAGRATEVHSAAMAHYAHFILCSYRYNGLNLSALFSDFIMYDIG